MNIGRAAILTNGGGFQLDDIVTCRKLRGDGLSIMAWMSFKKFAASEFNADKPASNTAKAPTGEASNLSKFDDVKNLVPLNASKDFSLDAIGQRNEVVRFRVAEMSDRLEELKSLQSDFSAILEPIIAIKIGRASCRERV